MSALGCRQAEATEVVQCPVEVVHVVGKKGAGEAENQLTECSFAEYIAQTVLQI